MHLYLTPITKLAKGPLPNIPATARNKSSVQCSDLGSAISHRPTLVKPVSQWQLLLRNRH